MTISAPTSDPPLSQAAIASALTPIFQLGLPIAMYQLPQVTGNTMMPELVADLAKEFPNLILFKDSSGTDEVALSGKMPSDVLRCCAAQKAAMRSGARRMAAHMMAFC